MPRPTLGDVANLAAVSKKTVSRVLNNEPSVTPLTKEKVKRAICTLNFQPDLSARRLRTGQSFLLALFYPDAGKLEGIYADPYVNALLRGALAACENHKYDLLLKPVSAQPTPLLTLAKDFISRTKVDGLVLTPPACDDNALVDFLVAERIPFIRIAPKTLHNLAAIMANDIDITTQAIEYLITQGHRAIAIVNPLLSHGAGVWRKQGFSAAMHKHQLPIPANYLLESSGEQLEQDIIALLSSPNRPTAIFATNDSYAVLIYKIAYQLNLKIPEQLSVLGFDDSPLANLIWPGLTSIKQPVQEMAESAVQLLIKFINNGTSNNITTHHCQLTIRDSIKTLEQSII